MNLIRYNIRIRTVGITRAAKWEQHPVVWWVEKPISTLPCSGYGSRSLKTLEIFFEKWRGRPAISIHFTSCLAYLKDDYTVLIDKYKNDGVIEHFGYWMNKLI